MTWRKHPPIGRIFTQINTKTTSQDLVHQKITGDTQFLSNLKLQFKKDRRVPIHIQEKIGEEIKRLIREG